MALRRELSGKKFGRLTALSPAKTRGGHSYWLCRCDCGNDLTVQTASLIHGRASSCGCARTDANKARNRFDSKNNRTYYVWAGMLGRCENRNRPEWRHYGGRGIKVCERWHVFENFLADMGPKPEGLSIDRRDNDGHYEPGNCRWATQEQQHRNTRSNHLLSHDGVVLTLSEWEKAIGIKRSALSARIRKGWSISRALTTPTAPHRSHSLKEVA